MAMENNHINTHNINLLYRKRCLPASRVPETFDKCSLHLKIDLPSQTSGPRCKGGWIQKPVTYPWINCKDTSPLEKDRNSCWWKIGGKTCYYLLPLIPKWSHKSRAQKETQQRLMQDFHFESHDQFHGEQHHIPWRQDPLRSLALAGRSIS